MDKIIGLGNALTDVLVSSSDAELSALALPRGGMTLIDAERLRQIDAYLQTKSTHTATGGSAANTIAALSMLGAQTGFVGKVGSDRFGRFFADSLQARGTDNRLLVTDDQPSGVAVTFITDDGERTFATHLGAAAELKADELGPDSFKGGSWLYVEGYLVQDEALITQAMRLAKAAGLMVCLDMASYNVVAANRDFFRRTVSKYVDIVFANEEEARAFTGKEPEEALADIAAQCSIAVVKVGSRGSMVKKADETVKVDALKISHVADTTGAGDFFAAGFLYGLTCGYPLDRCARIGTTLSAEVIQVVGTTLAEARWEEIKEQLQQNNI